MPLRHRIAADTIAVGAFLRQSDAVVRHNVESQLGRIGAPTLLTFGRHDAVTSLRFADPLRANVRDVELLIFEDCAHAALYQNVEEFNQKTLAFLQRHAGAGVA